MTGRRPDGYHELSSVFLRVGLSDRLRIRPAEADAPADAMEVVGAGDLPLDDELASRAVRLLRQSTGIPLPPLALRLEKRIPMGAGLAGGSSDAAAALRGAAHVWGLGLSPAVEMRLALALGADVPFFLGGHAAALVEGIGERLSPLPAPRGEPGLLLITPPLRLSTPAVFRSFDDLAEPGPDGIETVQALAQGLRDGMTASDLVGWSDRLASANDLWPAAAAVEPLLAELRERIESRIGRRVLLTGSGSTLVALYASPEEAADAAHRLGPGIAGTGSGWSIVACDTTGPDPLGRAP